MALAEVEVAGLYTPWFSHCFCSELVKSLSLQLGSTKSSSEPESMATLTGWALEPNVTAYGKDYDGQLSGTRQGRKKKAVSV